MVLGKFVGKAQPFRTSDGKAVRVEKSSFCCINIENMYQVDEKDKVIELKNVPQSSVGSPLPIVLSDEHTILLAYLLQNVPKNWDSKFIRVVDYESEEFIAVVEFERYSSFMFGMPNDEAIHGHPLYERGLQSYGVFVIENSSWIRRLEKMNSVHPYHNPKSYAQLKHFIFAFHDSTFECVAESFEISIHEGSLENILSKMGEKLFSKYNW